MNILTKKYYFFSVFLLLTTNHFTLIASEPPYIPVDVQKKILQYLLENDSTEYAIAANNVVKFREKLFTSYTNRPFAQDNNIVRIQNIIRGLNPASETLRVKKTTTNLHCFNTQAWHSYDMREDNINHYLLLYIANKAIECNFRIGDISNPTFECFDGINNNGMAIFAQSNKEKFEIYVLYPSQKNDIYNLIDYRCPHQGLGQLWSIMVHPKKNTLMYSTIHSNPEHKENPFTINILDKSFMGKINERTQYVNFLIQKIIHIGKENYLGLTNTGEFIFLWEGINQPMEYAIQKHTLIIKDFAVDETVTRNGFYPHIVCLDYQGNIFVGDLFKFSQPTLFWVRKMIWGPQHKPTGLFYDNGHYGILYEENKNEKNEYCDGYTTLVTWPANLNLLCLGKEIGLPQAHI